MPLHFHDLSTFLFDVDGTLIDSNAQHAASWAEALQQQGIACEVSQVRPLVGMGADKLLPIVAGVEADSVAGLAIADRKRVLFSKLLPRLSPTPGARALLTFLHNEQKQPIVATSASEQEVAALLKQARLADLMPRRASKSEAANSKPDPDIVHAALAEAGAPANRAVMIGDTPYDIEAARRSGVITIALRCGGHWTDGDLRGAAAIFDDPRDLLAFWRLGAGADRSVRSHV